MFKRRNSDKNPPRVSIDFEGRLLEVNAKESVAAALLASGVDFMRTTAKHKAKRGPYCQMGVCFECLVEIDGKPNQQACMTPVRQGMKIRRMTEQPIMPGPRADEKGRP